MARVNSLNRFPVCISVVGSVAEGYIGAGGLPDFYAPIRFNSETDAMAMFWRVRTWGVTLQRTTAPYDTDFTPYREPTPETYNFDLTLQPTIDSEEELVCNNSLFWIGTGSQLHADGSTVEYGGGITCDLTKMFYVSDDSYYLPFWVDLGMGDHIYSSDPPEPTMEIPDAVTFVSEWNGSGVDIAASTSDFTLFGTSNSDLFAVLQTPLIALPLVSGLSLSVSPSSYWPYANSEGVPVYDTATGAQINPD